MGGSASTNQVENSRQQRSNVTPQGEKQQQQKIYVPPQTLTPQGEKCYDPRDMTLIFTEKEDVLDGK